MSAQSIPSKKRASIREVAVRAGVSPMTVSNVVRERAGQMADETRQRVLRAIHDLEYVPVRTAAQNRHVQTNAIGVIFLQAMQGAVGYPTFQGMCERAGELNYDLTIFLRSEPNWVKPGTEAQFLDRRCDGFIFVGDNRPEVTEILVRHGIPVVECYSVAPAEGAARVLGDNRSGMRQAVAHLAAQGHRRIAHMGGPIGALEADERLAGFQEAMLDICGVSDAPVVRGTSWGDLWGFGEADPGLQTQPLAEQILALDVTAVVCANDMLALALWRMAQERGLRVPEDLSIIGMDNIVQAAHRGLSSVSLSFDQVGHAAVDAIRGLLAGKSSSKVSRVLPVNLVQRLSVGPPPA